MSLSLAQDADADVLLDRDPPALHRYPRSMAQRVQALAAAVLEGYDGDVTAIWTGLDSGRELFRRLAALPGFGSQKAQICTALLGKQRGVTPPGRREAAGDYGEDGVHRSAADVVDAESLVRVREYKQAIKASAGNTATKG
ncbi:HhH-GPD-type base excision DNA repair protein [Pseudonocardia asaccharolytica]|uniref:HhH-GPD-type base excision DNA repair protein n=1 Tax=Pseudonocardia asaccharolytica TaxID=54010 RepID=UPI0021C14583|nr:HhH-GPD-type base excision DNA repair protein [Pseudonocardia asaccharolytica]